MNFALQYIWLLPVMVGIVGVFYFGMKDFGGSTDASRPTAKTED